MFVYCGNNPVLHSDRAGTFFFTAMGALTGFIAGAVTAMITGEPKEEWFDIAVDGAIGGAIAGAGVDMGLLLIGSCGAALPVVALAGGIAFAAGGLGNAYTTYATSDGTASDGDMTTSFVIGGLLNIVSLGTGMSATASSIDELFYLAGKAFNGNLITGLIIAGSTSVATVIGTCFVE